VIKAIIDKRGLKRIRREFRSDLSGSSRGPIRKSFHVMAKMYSSRMRRRFRNEGEGEWPALKPSTIAGRRKGKGKGNSSAKTLRDTGLLLNGLTIGGPGNLFKDIKNGVVFGYSSARHGADSVSYLDLAVWHSEGKGNLPVRAIIVAPDAATQKRMMDAHKRGWQQALRKSQTNG